MQIRRCGTEMRVRLGVRKEILHHGRKAGSEFGENASRGGAASKEIKRACREWEHTEAAPPGQGLRLRAGTGTAADRVGEASRMDPPQGTESGDSVRGARC